MVSDCIEWDKYADVKCDWQRGPCDFHRLSPHGDRVRGLDPPWSPHLMNLTQQMQRLPKRSFQNPQQNDKMEISVSIFVNCELSSLQYNTALMKKISFSFSQYYVTHMCKAKITVLYRVRHMFRDKQFRSCTLVQDVFKKLL